MRTQAALWKRLVESELATPDTWEVALSGAGRDKRAHWERLLAERKLGALALLRNLRNMQAAGVSEELVLPALAAMKTDRVLPFRFLAAARHAPQWEQALERAMFRAVEDAASCRPHDPAGGRVGFDGVAHLQPFGDAAHGCGVRAGSAAARNCEKVSVHLLRQREAGAFAARIGPARRDGSSQPHGERISGAALKR